jgi:hypothetical protein
LDPRIIDALRRLDPARPADASEYIDRNVEGKPRSWDLVERLRVLVAAGQRPRILLHGAIGVGKTTELDAIERSLTEVTTIRVALNLGADSRLDGRAAKQIAQAVNAKAQGLGWSSTGRVEDAVPELESRTQRPVLVLVDGLDLINDSDRAHATFGPGTALTGPAFPAMVLTAPHAMITWSGAERDAAFDEVHHLPAFALCKPDGSPNAAALLYFAEGLRRRISMSIIDNQLLLRAALYSAGIPRDAVRILRAALVAAATVGKVNAAHLLAGERQVRHDREGALRPGDPEILAEVAKHGNYVGDARLIERGALVAYERDDGSRYWRPHPLLEDFIRANVARSP